MRYALIIAGGSGTRLWPMSTRDLPKQLIPFIAGRSLLEIAVDRLSGLLPPECIYICAGESHRQAILDRVHGMTADRFIGEPMGRDTLNAVGLGTAVLEQQDPDAVVGVFTADHIIEPEEQFREVVERGYTLAEQHADTLVTFGIAPTHAATGFGYLQLGAAIDGRSAYRVEQFKEKPQADIAQEYYEAGATQYLWNSGMFVWQARTLMSCIDRFAPQNAQGLRRCAEAWGSGERGRVIEQVYPTLRKISVDYAVMEPASRDRKVNVAAVPMPLSWLDVGSWPSFAKTCRTDEQGNALATDRHVLMDSANTLAASSDPDHLIATIGVDDLIVIHTPRATLVCRRDQAERIKQLHEKIGETFGEELL